MRKRRRTQERQAAPAPGQQTLTMFWAPERAMLPSAQVEEGAPHAGVGSAPSESR